MSAPLTAAALEDVCARAIAGLDVAGAQAAVLAGGELVHAAVGTANRELDLAVTDDTVFQIGSVTKLWTAVLMMQLVDQGLVDLDRPVTDYLPDVALAPDADPWTEISPRHLMSMTSGLDNGPYTDTGRGDDCVERYVRLLAGVPMIFRPGTAYGYSNASTRVSGLLVERLTGMAWDDALRGLIIRPAGLAETVSLFDELPYHRVAVGHYPGETRVHRPWHLGRGMAPSGQTLASSARDLIRFAQVFLDRGVAPNGARLLSAAAVDTMQTPQVRVPVSDFASDWCVGPYRRIWDGLDVFGHLGTAPNGASTLVWIPQLHAAIAVVLNTPPAGARFAQAVIDAVADGLGIALPSATPPTAPHFEGDPMPYVGRYESHGRSFDVGAEPGGLVLTMTAYDQPANPHVARSELLPVGTHRFVAADDAVTWSFGWDLAFTMGDDGRAAIFHNGAFASRRVA